MKIALLGMDERSVTRMATIFKVVYKNRCVISPEDQANLAIIDLDGEADAWEDFQKKYPDMPAIVMSESASSAEGAIYINKPAKLDLLWKSISRLMPGLPSVEIPAPKTDAVLEQAIVGEVVEKIQEEQSAEGNQHTSVIKVAEKPAADILRQDEASIFFNADEYLLGHILSALKTDAGNQCSIHVQCWKDRQLILLSDEGLAFTDLTDGQLKILGSAKVDEEHDVEINSICGTGTNETSSLWSRAYARLLGKGEIPTINTDGLQSMPLDHLLWSLARHTSRGRVPVGTDLSRPLYLRCWPNFPRLPNTPHSMRIASLWVGEPRTLNNIATSLGVDVAEVHTFYSAAVATGLAGPTNRQADGLVDAHRSINKTVLKPDVRNAILRHVENS